MAARLRACKGRRSCKRVRLTGEDVQEGGANMGLNLLLLNFLPHEIGDVENVNRALAKGRDMG